LADLEHNLNDLVKKYKKDLIVVEYSALKKEVNHIAFSLPNNKGKGTCIWEPLNTWEKIFETNGQSNQLLPLYDQFRASNLNAK
jgi:beta-galactosidase